MTNFSIDWPHGHITRDGRPARIICTDSKGYYPIVALIDYEGYEAPVAYPFEGKLCRNRGENTADLFNKQPVLRAWVNVYDGWFSPPYKTKQEADDFADEWSFAKRIACIPIEYDPSEAGK